MLHAAFCPGGNCCYASTVAISNTDGNAVVSAAGMSMANSNYTVTDTATVLIAFVGLGIKAMKLPASHMMGPFFGFVCPYPA